MSSTVVPLAHAPRWIAERMQAIQDAVRSGEYEAAIAFGVMKDDPISIHYCIPDDVRLSSLLMVRAILDKLIHSMVEHP